MLSDQTFIRTDSTRHGTEQRVLLLLFRFAIGGALLTYLFKWGILDFRALSKLFIMWPITFAAVMLLLIDSALMSIRLSWLFRPQGLNLRFGTSLKLTLVGFFFATFLPGAAGGDLSKLFYTTRGCGGRRIEIMIVVLLDRAIGLFSLLLLPLLFAPILAQGFGSESGLRMLLLTLGLLALCVFAGFLVCLYTDSLLNRIPGSARDHVANKKIVRQIGETVAAYRKNFGILFAAVGLSLLANLLLVFVTMLGAVAVAPSSWTPKMFLVIPIGHIMNSLPLTPGGLGVGETAFNALFSLTGLRGGAEALLCTRIWMAIIALVGLAFYLHGINGEIFEESGTVDEPCSAVLGTIES